MKCHPTSHPTEAGSIIIRSRFHPREIVKHPIARCSTDMTTTLLERHKWYFWSSHQSLSMLARAAYEDSADIYMMSRNTDSRDELIAFNRQGIYVQPIMILRLRSRRDARNVLWKQAGILMICLMNTKALVSLWSCHIKLRVLRPVFIVSVRRAPFCPN